MVDFYISLENSAGVYYYWEFTFLREASEPAVNWVKGDGWRGVVTRYTKFILFG